MDTDIATILVAVYHQLVDDTTIIPSLPEPDREMAILGLALQVAIEKARIAAGAP